MADVGDEAMADSPDQVRAPLVFMCAGCSRIVGDSFNFVASYQEMDALVLSAAQGVSASEKDLTTSKQGPDAGCGYSTITCSNCKARLGKLYRITSRAFDHFRDVFTFDVKKLSSYQLGTAENNPKAHEQPDALRGIEELKQAFDMEVMKVKALVLVHDEQIAKLAELIQGTDSNGVGDEAPPEPKRQKRKRGDTD